MSLDVSWPTSLPLPLLQGYGLEDDPGVERSDMEAGSARQRRRTTQMSTAVTVQWEFTLFEYALFEGWLRHKANFVAWFDFQYLAGMGLVACEARFQKGKAPAKFYRGNLVMVSATLDVRDRPMLSADDLDILLDAADGELAADLAAIQAALFSMSPSP